MNTSVKRWVLSFGLSLTGLGLSTMASAGAASSGSITFVAVETAPALPVPTFGVMAAVILAMLFGAMALRTLHRNRQTFASIVLISASLGTALIVASAGIVRAVPGTMVSDFDLGKPMNFSCTPESTTTIFENFTQAGIPIKVSSINPGACTIDSSSTCSAQKGSETILASFESCTVVASLEF